MCLLKITSQEYQKAQNKLLDISNEKRQAEESAAAAERLRADVQQLQRELFLAGEQQQRMHEKIQFMALNYNRPEEFTSIKEAYHEELNSKSYLNTLQCPQYTITRFQNSEYYIHLIF